MCKHSFLAFRPILNACPSTLPELQTSRVTSRPASCLTLTFFKPLGHLLVIDFCNDDRIAVILVADILGGKNTSFPILWWRNTSLFFKQRDIFCGISFIEPSIKQWLASEERRRFWECVWLSRMARCKVWICKSSVLRVKNRAFCFLRGLILFEKVVELEVGHVLLRNLLSTGYKLVQRLTWSGNYLCRLDRFRW
jgi:hypothetical protein